MHQVDTQQARAWPLPGRWIERGSRTSLERLHTWKVTSLAVDAVMLLIAGVVFSLLSSPRTIGAILWLGAFSALVVLLLSTRGLYAPRLRLQFLDDLPVLLSSTATAAMVVAATRVLVDDAPNAASTVHAWMLATACLMVGRGAVHLAQARARREGEAERPTLIIGAGRVAQITAKRLLERPELGFRPVGFLDKEPLAVERSLGLPVLGASWDLDRIISEYGVQHVIVTFSTAPDQVLVRLTRRCWELGVSVSLVPRLFEVEGKRVPSEHLGGLPLVAVNHSDPKGWQFRVKYAIDRAIAALALLVLSPIFAAIAAAVWISMGRPIFYRQVRVGRDGHEFEMLKFRTMRGKPEESGEADVDWALKEVTSAAPLGSSNGASKDDRAEQSNGRHASAEDVTAEDRRTPVGRLLRHFSLDEIPQLLNVLRGDMSLVGPRPERVGYVEQFKDVVYRYGERHRVKSGITGWAQVHGLRGKTSLSDRVEWDNYYVENWSPWLDLKIILMTIGCVLRGQHEEMSPSVGESPRGEDSPEPRAVTSDRR